MTQGIILAAGLGSRLKEITKVTPKSLLCVNGKPILERNIEFMIEAGMDRIILLVGYMKERFTYLQEKYANVDLRLVENKDFATSNTVSSMFYARDFFDCASFVTTADIYLAQNPYRKYGEERSFYLLRPATAFEKPEWVAELSGDAQILSVNKHAFAGHSYTGISHWRKEDLCFIRRELEKIDWRDVAQRKQYWDELLLPYLPEFALYARVLEDNAEIYEFDDLSDIENFQKECSAVISYPDGTPVLG